MIGLKRKKIRNNSGFTMIEIIVASFIVVCAAIPLLASFVSSNKINVKGRQKEQAMTVAENLVEGVKAVGAYNSYLWSVGSTSGFTVVPDGSYKNRKGQIYIETKNVDISGYEMPNGDKLGDLLDEEDVKKTLTLSSYVLKIDGVLMGQTEYDAYVFVEQDSSDVENLAAYAYKSEFEKAGINVMDYYQVTVYVGIGFDNYVESELPLGNASHTDDVESFKELLKDHCLAKYTGTVITQS